VSRLAGARLLKRRGDWGFEKNSQVLTNHLPSAERLALGVLLEFRCCLVLRQPGQTCFNIVLALELGNILLSIHRLCFFYWAGTLSNTTRKHEVGAKDIARTIASLICVNNSVVKEISRINERQLTLYAAPQLFCQTEG